MEPSEIKTVKTTIEDRNDYLGYTKEEFEIEKINLIEISEDLSIAKETVRRKINELNEDQIIMRKGKKIVLKPLTFIHQRPKHSIKRLRSSILIEVGLKRN